jgi:hypothetical protein
MYLANLETANFSFFTFANTREEAISQLKSVWLQHRQLTGATYSWEDIKDDVWAQFFRSGDTYTDRELTHSLDTPADPYPQLEECEECFEVIEGFGFCSDCERCRCHGETHCHLENN